MADAGEVDEEPVADVIEADVPERIAVGAAGGTIGRGIGFAEFLRVDGRSDFGAEDRRQRGEGLQRVVADAKFARVIEREPA